MPKKTFEDLYLWQPKELQWCIPDINKSNNYTQPHYAIKGDENIIQLSLQSSMRTHRKLK